jgi:hypothetical protein
MNDTSCKGYSELSPTDKHAIDRLCRLGGEAIEEAANTTPKLTNAEAIERFCDKWEQTNNTATKKRLERTNNSSYSDINRRIDKLETMFYRGFGFLLGMILTHIICRVLNF